MGAFAICAPCATGECSGCHHAVRTAGGGSKLCGCTHGGPSLARTSDPRPVNAPDGIVGGAPDQFGTTMIDTTNAVLVDDLTVATCENPSDGRVMVALLLGGRVNRTPDPVSVLAIINADGAAAVVTEITGLAARMGPVFEQEFRDALGVRLAAADLWPATPEGAG